MSNRPSRQELVSVELGTWLLGVDWAHLNDFMPVKDDRGNLLPFKVQSNSGFSAVVPAWRLGMLLDSPKVADSRHRWYMEQTEKLGRPAVTKTSAQPSDVAEKPAKDENPRHREDFTSLLGKAARTPPQDD